MHCCHVNVMPERANDGGGGYGGGACGVQYAEYASMHCTKNGECALCQLTILTIQPKAGQMTFVGQTS